LLTHVDDNILAENSLCKIQDVKEYLDNAFKIKDLHQLKYFLNLKVVCFRKTFMFAKEKIYIFMKTLDASNQALFHDDNKRHTKLLF